MTISILSVTPTTLLPQTPTVLTVEELTRLLSLPILRHLLVTGLSGTYLRKLAKEADTTYQVRDQGGTLELSRLDSPRGYMTLAKLDSELAWHASRITSILETRPTHLRYSKGLATLTTHQAQTEAAWIEAMDEPLEETRHNQPPTIESVMDLLGGEE